MPRTKNCRSRKQEYLEGNLSSDDEPLILKLTKKKLANAKDSPTPKKIDKFEPDTFESSPPRSTSSPTGPSSNDQGLDWDWVKALDQDPTGKKDFPGRFDPPEELGTLGLDMQRPDLDFTGDLKEFSTWALARLRRMRASNAIARMLSDPNVKVKWELAVNTYWKNAVCHYRDIAISGSGPNHEAAYAAMCGIVLPPEHACENCRANRTVFTYCIVLPGYLKGSCVGCHYNNSGSRCTHRPDARTRTRAMAMLLNDLSPAPATTLAPIRRTPVRSNPNAVRSYGGQQPRLTSASDATQRRGAPRGASEAIEDIIRNAIEEVKRVITEADRKGL
ncbi:hypothetical protein GGR53DRAFT_353264 [Hypoxylon sp. FL1150]|nr:hypothetical protein GGR53DRAFT_353264 [Hypoxylon sp. FL1150]